MCGAEQSLRKPELQKPDWQTRLAKVWRLLRFHSSNVKAEARSLIQEENLV